MNGSASISQLFLENSFYECHKWSHYPRIYQKHLARFLDKNPVILEIGVKRGGSLNIWRKFFGKSATIIGIDIDKKCESIRRDGFEIYVGDQSDKAFLAGVLKKHPEIDILIDDGSHAAKDIISSFEYLYPRIKKDGVYIIEDVSSAMLAAADSGDINKQSLGDYFKDLIGQINLGFVEEKFLADKDNVASNFGKAVGKMTSERMSSFSRPTEITAATSDISFYPNMIVLEKYPQSIRASLKSAGMVAGRLQAYRTYLLE